MIRWVISPSQEWVNRLVSSLDNLKGKYPSITQTQALKDLFKDIAPVSRDKSYTDGKTAYQLYDILFGLIKRGYK